MDVSVRYASVTSIGYSTLRKRTSSL
jgi:hypothetical protein